MQYHPSVSHRPANTPSIYTIPLSDHIYALTDQFKEESYLAKVGIRGEVFVTEDGFTRRKPTPVKRIREENITSKVTPVEENPKVVFVPDQVLNPFVSFDHILTAHINMVKSFQKIISTLV
jgi:hypothetical protein